MKCKFAVGDYAWFHRCKIESDRICRITEVYAYGVKIVFWKDGWNDSTVPDVMDCGCRILAVKPTNVEIAAWKLLYET